MPELPEVASFRRFFDRHFLQRRIASAQARNPKIVRGVSARELEEALPGRSFPGSRQHGKYFFAQVENSPWVVMHFGMNGYLESFENPEEEPLYTRLLIEFEDGGFFAYVNQRMLGWVGLAADPDELIAEKGLGPDALSGNIRLEEFREKFAGRRGDIKPALMDQSIIAGIGNIYSDEILFQARIHPRKKVHDLGPQQIELIFEKSKSVLRTAVDRNADTSAFPENFLLRDRRKGALCPVCGNKLRTAKVSGRTAYFCPRCQSE